MGHSKETGTGSDIQVWHAGRGRMDSPVGFLVPKGHATPVPASQRLLTEGGSPSRLLPENSNKQFRPCPRPLLWSRQPFNPWTPVILCSTLLACCFSLPPPFPFLGTATRLSSSCPVPTIFSLNLRLFCLAFRVKTHSGAPLYGSYPHSLS